MQLFYYVQGTEMEVILNNDIYTAQIAVVIYEY